MTIASETSRNQYNCDGNQTEFPYTFRILDESHLKVVLADSGANETVLTLNSDYTVSGVGDEGGGNITTAQAYASGYTLTIIRDVPATQETDYVENDPFPAQSHENALDKLTMLIQQHAERLARAVLLPISSELSDLTFPVMAGQALGWNEAGTALTTYSTNAVSRSDLKSLSVDYGSSLATMVNLVGSEETTVLIDVPSSLDQSLIIPSNIHLIWLRGAKVTIAAGALLTIESLEAGRYQIFDGDGDVSFGSKRIVAYPEWWGALNNGDSGPNAAAINKAIAASFHVVASGVYNLEDEIDFTPWATGTNTSGINGFFDASATKFTLGANVTQMISLCPTDGSQLLRHKFLFGKISGYGSYTASRLVYIRHCSNCIIEVLEIANGSNDGILIDQSGTPSYGCFNNLFTFGDIVENGSRGLVLKADTTGVLGVEGNNFVIFRIGFNNSDGLVIGEVNNSRVFNNIFKIGVIEHNGSFGIYIRSGTNQIYIGNTNNNTNGGLGQDSGLDNGCFIVGGFDEALPSTVLTENTLFDTTITNAGLSSAWNGNHLKMLGYHLWVDGSGNLRIKSGKPTSDTDGIVVGTQT